MEVSVTGAGGSATRRPSVGSSRVMKQPTKEAKPTLNSSTVMPARQTSAISFESVRPTEMREHHQATCK